MFNFLKKKTSLQATVDDFAGFEDYYKEHERECTEFEASLQPLKDEQSKAKFVIKQILQI